MTATDEDDAAIGEAKKLVVRSICAVAPELEDEIADVSDEADIWELFGLDSLDRLSFFEHLTELSGVAVEDGKYQELRSIDDLVRHIRGGPGNPA